MTDNSSPTRPERRTFGNRLRDFFAAVGFCESTTDLARRPALLTQVFAQSAGYAHDITKTAMPYDARLRRVLDGVSTYTLDRLAAEKVAVCLDVRQVAQDVGFWNNRMLALFYNGPDKKIAALYDNGKGPDESGFFERTVFDWGRPALNGLVREVLDRDMSGTIYAGTTHVRNTGKSSTTYFKWHDEAYFARELEKNPELRRAPQPN